MKPNVRKKGGITLSKDQKNSLSGVTKIREIFFQHGHNEDEAIKWWDIKTNSRIKRALRACKKEPVEDVAEFVSQNLKIEQDRDAQFFRKLVDSAKRNGATDYPDKTYEDADNSADRVAGRIYTRVLNWYDKNVLGSESK